MCDALSFAETDSQYVELLPARTVMSVFVRGSNPSGGGQPAGGGTNNSVGDTGIASCTGVQNGIAILTTSSCNPIAPAGGL
jgi:hypothetical protein